MVIDVDVATLLQAQLGETLGIGENATIFEICAAIDAQQEDLDITAVIDALELDLDPIVTAQISQLVNQIAIAISEITGEPINQALIDEILASIDIDDIVAQITANVQVSLGILETCLGQEPPPRNNRNINSYQKYRLSSRCSNLPTKSNSTFKFHYCNRRSQSITK